RPTDEQILVGRLLDRIFRKSKAVDTEGLCIVAGEHVWTVRVDIHFLDHDGNLLDAACLAASIALSHFRRPFVSLDENEQVVLHSIYEKNPVPLAIHFIPISTTFSIFDNGIVLVDCTSIEEKIQLGQLTITMNRQRELVAVSKAGGAMISVNTYLQCQQLAVAEIDELIDRIELFIKSDLESRRKIK
ncbi:Ribosomal protein S5 2-type fold domain-containing protein, partial [Rozella allomycis CSF55]